MVLHKIRHKDFIYYTYVLLTIGALNQMRKLNTVKYLNSLPMYLFSLIVTMEEKWRCCSSIIDIHSYKTCVDASLSRTTIF